MTSILARLGVAAALIATSSIASAELPRSASIGTNPQGSLFYAVTSGVASVLSDELPVNFRPRPMGGTTQFVPLIDSGELEFGVNNIHDGRMAYYGIEPWGHFPGMRAISPLIRLQSAMVVAAESGITRIGEAVGKRITSDYSAHLISRMTTDALLANEGYSVADFRPVPVTSHVEGVRALQEGRADIVYGAFNPAMREADASISGGVRFIGISDDEASVARMLEVLPGSGVDPLPAGHFVGINEDIKVIGYDVYMTAGKSVSEDLVYAVTKALWDREADLKAAHREMASRFARDNMVQLDVTFPYHPGAIRFYREQGLWSDEMEAANQAMLADQNQDY